MLANIFPNFYTEWVEKGIKTLNDLVARNGTFKCFNDVKEVVGTNNFLNYFCIVSKVPRKIKRQISDFKTEMNHGVFLNKLMYFTEN
jgi:hypothetical protein